MRKIHVPVLFRVDSDGDVTAVFPAYPYDETGATVTAYAHVGQHSCASWEWVSETREATRDEAAPLLAELRSIYESEPDPCILVPIFSTPA